MRDNFHYEKVQSKVEETKVKCRNCGSLDAKEYVMFQGIGRHGLINRVVRLCDNCHKLFLEEKLEIKAEWVETKLVI
jgi:hypothetical protein